MPDSWLAFIPFTVLECPVLDRTRPDGLSLLRSFSNRRTAAERIVRFFALHFLKLITTPFDC
jgi:hypothetical protein